MDSEAAFLDGPKSGTTFTFKDREEPPRLCSVEVDDGEDRYGNPTTKTMTYIRDVSPYPDGPRWVYMLDSEMETDSR